MKVQEITKRRQEELAVLKGVVDPQDIIKELNLSSYVDREGPNYVRLHVPWRRDEHPSLVVFWGTKTNCWQWKDMAQGWTGSNVDFWAKVKNTDYVTAVREMREAFLGRSYQPHTMPQQPQQQKQGREKSKVEKAKVVPLEPKIKILKVQPVRHPALVQYMQKRGISVRPDWLKEVHWQERGKKFFALGVQDRSGNWHLRNRLTKRCLKTSDKEATYTWVKKGKLAVAVFEGLFDALTWHEANRRGCRWAVDTDIVVLNSVANTKKLLKDGVLEKYSTIYLALDRDQTKAGQRAAEMIEKAIRNKFSKEKVVVNLGEIYGGLYGARKDLNEAWQVHVKQRPEKEEKEKQQFEIGF